ncbi:hypothetical protein [Acidovorax sp. A1169]|uniref:hypothetical protein n=1 Tax=Acidovorax sp. A1169 TaxID=3059524 RepID=UPI002737B836|nr:hypothetical protein [Acidovorax sp. A1169]MDP4072854.1 hypothetical protein [Acidovorax sp. A1169]
MIERRRSANAGVTTSKASHTNRLSPNGDPGYVRMQAGLHLVGPGFESQRRFGGVVDVLPFLSHCFLQRMLVELQTINLGVAGSNPAGCKAVAQWIEHVKRFTDLVAALHQPRSLAFL